MHGKYIFLWMCKGILKYERNRYCPKCKKHQPATKTVEFWTLPDVLVVHLKRFSGGRMMRDKIDDIVDFPLT